MSLTIKTNNVPRDIIYGLDLSKEERKQFDYIDGCYDDSYNDFDCHPFIRYKGHVYDLSDFMRIPKGMFPGDWHCYSSDSFSNGVLVRFVNDGEQVVCGTYIS